MNGYDFGDGDATYGSEAGILPVDERHQHEYQPRHETNIGVSERALTTLGGGALLGAGLAYAMRHRSGVGAIMAVAGGALLYRGVTGHCDVYERLGVHEDDAGRWSGPMSRSIEVTKAITINKPAEELYRHWRKLEELPRIMRHLDRVEVIDEKRSRWSACAPMGRTVEWEAEITEDTAGKVIAWRSVEDSTVDNAGRVEFEKAPGNRGTILRVQLRYHPPAGAIGAAIAKLFGEEPATQIDGDLRRFKQLIESGEIATNASPSARGDTAERVEKAQRQKGLAAGVEVKPSRTATPPHGDRVAEASEESFPASDAPGWTQSRA